MSAHLNITPYIMQITEKTVTLRRIVAAEGHCLTQADPNTPIADRTFGSEITLAATDSPANWKEITTAEADELKQEQLNAYQNT